MAWEIRTGRGLCRIVSAAQSEAGAAGLALTLGLERADGIERVVFRCRIARELLGAAEIEDEAKIIERLAPWLEREFEQVREAALKSIRAERKLHEINFDRAFRGPF